MKNFQIAGCTDVGRARQHNEDSMISFDSPNGYVVAVCDGMGGENGGETASNLAVAIIQDILTNNTFPTPSEAITVACNAANQGILHRASSRPELNGMGSTCVMAVVKDGQIYYGTIGDSRIYYYSHTQGLAQLSKDQSYVQTLVDSGEITPEEAESHPRKNEILNALGLDGMTPPVVCDQPMPVNAGGLMMLCSDGLSGMVPDFTIEQVLSRPGLTPQQRCEKLINMANEAGGLDNITVQIIDCGATASMAPDMSAESSISMSHPTASTNLKNKKSFAWVGIAIVSALICGIVAYLTWNYFSESDKHDKENRKENTEINVEKKNNSGKTEKNTNTKTIVVKKKTESKKTVSDTKADNIKKATEKSDNDKKVTIPKLPTQTPQTPPTSVTPTSDGELD